MGGLSREGGREGEDTSKGGRGCMEKKWRQNSVIESAEWAEDRTKEEV